ncbi:uncharacterized protein [Dermacentor albipictus]|uniref:uncharacterized protein n=1 Tax=Dermacentor albipictus TaxID=60249 RepID=UPI0031FDAB87
MSQSLTATLVGCSAAAGIGRPLVYRMSDLGVSGRILHQIRARRLLDAEDTRELPRVIATHILEVMNIPAVGILFVAHIAFVATQTVQCPIRYNAGGCTVLGKFIARGQSNPFSDPCMLVSCPLSSNTITITGCESRVGISAGPPGAPSRGAIQPWPRCCDYCGSSAAQRRP